MRRGGRGEERDTTTHLIKIQVFIYASRVTKFSMLLTLAAKRRRRVTAIVWRFLSVCPSVRPSVRPHGKGRLRESTHLRITRHQGRVVTFQWYNGVQLWLPFCALLVSCQCSDSVNR